MKRTLFSAWLPPGLGLLVSLLFLSGPARACPDMQVAIALAAQQPFPGPKPHLIPGKIEAEDYDIGAQGVAYYDTTPGNQGSQHRSDDVDIEETADAGHGYNVGWIEEGEWLRYTLYVTETAYYDIQVRVASAMGLTLSDTLPVIGEIRWAVPLTKALHVEFDGRDVTGPLAFLTTGSWQNWTSVFARGVRLTEGEHQMRLSMDAGAFNVNWIRITESLPEDPIDSLLSIMTVEEKIDQLHGSDWMDTTDNTRLGIPGFAMADGPHGIRGGKATSFPVGIAMAATWDPELIEQVAIALGKEAQGKGQNQVLAPCLDITRDPRNGRSPESGGEEPFLIGRIGAAAITGIQSTQVVATPKHFLANNHQRDRRNINHTIDGRTLREFYGLPFRISVQQGGAWSIMNAYNWINTLPSSASYELLTNILRDEWGYRYYVVSDWGSIYTSASQALNAGCDLEMPHLSGRYPAELGKAIASGEVTTATLDQAVRRALRTKHAAGMFDSYPPGNPEDVCCQEHRALALRVAQESIVLLKNEGNILPLDKTRPLTIALVGPSADVAQLDGAGSSVVEACYAFTPKQGLENRTSGFPVNILYAKGCDINSDDASGFAAAIKAAHQADVVVFVGGLDNTQEGEEIDRVGGSVQLPGQQQPLIRALAAVNPNIVVVLESGGVVALEQCIDDIQGLIYAFYPGQEGGNAIADILFGDLNPSGKLPVTIPRDDSQLPTWDDLDFSGDLVDGFGYRRFDSLGSSPQYAFGYGLSYTTFDYGNLVVTPASTSGDLPVLAAVDVTNTGSRVGDEIAQLYLSVRFANVDAQIAVPMPVKQLRGFRRITLQPEQTQRVTFTLGPEELSYWSIPDDAFRIEAGTYTVRVGGSSDNLPLSAAFELTSSMLYDSVTGQTAPARLPVLRNVALHHPASCSSIESEDLACANAVDGNRITRWSSQFSDPQWIYVDLGARQCIERMILHWETAYGRTYQIQTSDDALTWTDIYSTTCGDGHVDNLDLSGTGRYVRLYYTQRATAWGYSLWELEIYARPDPIYLWGRFLGERGSQQHLCIEGSKDNGMRGDGNRRKLQVSRIAHYSDSILPVLR
ncbi:MAG: glycoside hydrolase family 3 C-terminal domain-containing protein [Anaerolineae bacterium]|jgi:beta-glucosidase